MRLRLFLYDFMANLKVRNVDKALKNEMSKKKKMVEEICREFPERKLILSPQEREYLIHLTYQIPYEKGQIDHLKKSIRNKAEGLVEEIPYLVSELNLITLCCFTPKTFNEEMNRWDKVDLVFHLFSQAFIALTMERGWGRKYFLGQIGLLKKEIEEKYEELEQKVGKLSREDREEWRRKRIASLTWWNEEMWNWLYGRGRINPSSFYLKLDLLKTATLSKTKKIKVKEIKEKYGIESPKASRLLNEMVDLDFLVKERRGVYRSNESFFESKKVKEAVRKLRKETMAL